MEVIVYNDQLSMLLFLFGAILTCLSLMMNHLIKFRVIYLFSSILFLFFGTYINNLTIIATSLLLIVINGYKIIYYIIYESQFQISNIGLRAYKRYEKHLTKKEFHHLMGICNISQLNSGVIVQKGDEVKKIMLILKGKAVVLNNQGIISELEPGDFIGEFGALSGDEASATIESKANLTVACWDPSIIDKEIVLGKIVSLNILKKLIANNKSTSDSNV